MPVSAPPSVPPVFIAGALRSGSTLLSLMLERHPAIDCHGEFDYLFDAFAPDGGVAGAERLDAAAFDAALAEHYGFLMRGRPMPAGRSTVERLRAHVAALSVEGKVMAMCVHRNFVSAQEIFPEARFIHLLRDPRDCARSAIGMGWAGNVLRGLEPWIGAEQSWDRLRPRLAPERFIEVRYEQLVAEPERELARLCGFLGLSFDAAMLDLSDTSYAPPSASYANQWRRNMGPGEERLVVARVGAMMQARGYEPRDPAPAPIGRFEHLRLRWQDRVARHRFRIARFGLPLYLGELLARSPGARSLHRAVWLRMLEIDKRYMQ